MKNINLKNVELLAPAGSYESFIAAINAGADAVYMGLKNFNARTMTNNFTVEEYKEAIDYAHRRNVKVYLTADSKVRAKRRFDELTAKGENCDIDKIEADIIERDYRDMNREISPLKQAEDAILVDTSYMNIDEVVETIMGLIKKNKEG